ncbi:poly [ADP-ribose] polymerase tankyrase-2-like isoform X1 [Branchiostoma floridae x Branchiostoma japonicum]
MTENSNTLLLHAAKNGSLEGVKAALEAGADIDYKQTDSDLQSTGTALFSASTAGHVDVVRLLLRQGASVVERMGSFAPLHGAAFEGRTAVVELLVQHGATVDIRDVMQNTPLMYACGNNHVDTVRRLIELGARPDLTDGFVAQRMGLKDRNVVDSDESIKMVQEAAKTRLLRCCNPKCGKPGYRSTGTLKLCGRCKLTRYCSRDCQKQHWSVGHKKCCGHDAYSVEQASPIQKMVVLMTNHILEHGYDDFVQVTSSLHEKLKAYK